MTTPPSSPADMCTERPVSSALPRRGVAWVVDGMHKESCCSDNACSSVSPSCLCDRAGERALRGHLRRAIEAPYLAYRLPKLGALLSQYYSIGHDNLGNYIAMISGQAPNAATQSDCKNYGEFKRIAPGLDGNGQVLGEGCVYPADVKTLTAQLDAKSLAWKGYMEDMGADPARESATCGHAAIGAQDYTNEASAKDQYAASSSFNCAIDFDRQRFAAEVINDVEGAEAPPVPQRIGHEVDRPAVVDLLTSHQWQRVPIRHPLLAATAAIELHQAIHTPYPLVIPHQSATVNKLEQLVEAPLGETLSQLGEQGDHRLVPIRTAPISRRRTRQPYRLTSLALAPVVTLHQPRDERALVRRVYNFFAMRSFSA